ncbi:hypothetical protein KQI63_15780 [bacterium]|nr:hypothetical protein [bacterium]
MDKAKQKKSWWRKALDEVGKPFVWLAGIASSALGLIGADQVVAMAADFGLTLPAWGVQVAGAVLGYITGKTLLQDRIPNTAWAALVNQAFDWLEKRAFSWGQKISARGRRKHGVEAWEARETALDVGSRVSQAASVVKVIGNRLPGLGQKLQQGMDSDD